MLKRHVTKAKSGENRGSTRRSRFGIYPERHYSTGSLEGTDPQSYMDLMERYGWAVANTSSLRVMWIDTYTLLDKLEDSDFLCVMVDHTLKLRQDFIEELKKRLEAYEE